MNRAFSIGLVLVSVFCAVSPLPAQGKKGKKDQAVLLEANKADYQALARMPGIYGKVTAFDANNNTMTLRVEYQIAQPNPKFKPGKAVNPKKKFAPAKKKRPNVKKKPNRNNFQNKNKNKKSNNRNKNKNRNGKGGNSPQQLMREYQQILRIQNPQQRQQRMKQFMAKLNKAQMQQVMKQQQMLRQQALQNQRQYQQILQKQQQQLQKQFAKNPRANPAQGAYKLVTVAKEFDLPVSQNVRVARRNLPFEYDDKGFVKKYTDEEKKKLLDGVLPGYKATADDVANGQVVYVYFGKIKAPEGEKKKEGINLNPTPATNAAPGLRVNGLLIVVDYDFSSLPGDNGKKRKKKN